MDFLQSFNELVKLLPFGEYIWTILMFLIVLSVLVFFHELGHYSAARSVGVKVETFSIGFGKEIFGWFDKKGTRWKVCWLPFGGYVQMYGDGSEEVPEDRKHEAFLQKAVLKKMWVVFAGPLANFVIAVLLIGSLMVTTGEQKMLPKVGEVLEGTPAQASGLQAGDTILTINGVEVQEWFDVQDQMALLGEGAVPLLVERSGENVAIALTPEMKERENRFGEVVRVPFAGIAPSGEKFTIEYGFVEGVERGVMKTYEFTSMILTSLGKIIAGNISADKIGGPIMIAQVAGDAGEQGVYQLFMFMALISVNLGLINLFPIPVLDGGHLLFFLIEGIKGSPVSEKIQGYTTNVGVALVMLLMVFATFNDLRRVLLGMFGAE